MGRWVPLGIFVIITVPTIENLMRYVNNVINVILINYSLKRCSKDVQNHDLPVAVFGILFERFGQSAKIIPMNFDKKYQEFRKSREKTEILKSLHKA